MDLGCVRNMLPRNGARLKLPGLLHGTRAGTAQVCGAGCHAKETWVCKCRGADRAGRWDQEKAAPPMASPTAAAGVKTVSAPIDMVVDPRKEHNKIRMQMTVPPKKDRSSPYGTPKGLKSPMASPLVKVRLPLVLLHL